MIKETASLESIKDHGDAWEIRYDGWTFFGVTKEMLPEAPEIGSPVVYATTGGSLVRYLKIGGTEVINKSDDDLERERQEWLAEYNRQREEEYRQHRDEWNAQAKSLIYPLRQRIERFVEEQGEQAFWTDGGPYELAILRSADVLVRHVRGQFPDDTASQLWWICYWDGLNTAAQGYDYKRQMEILPEFGDGHSGFSHSAAVGIAKMVVEGKPV